MYPCHVSRRLLSNVLGRLALVPLALASNVNADECKDVLLQNIFETHEVSRIRTSLRLFSQRDFSEVWSEYSGKSEGGSLR